MTRAAREAAARNRREMRFITGVAIVLAGAEVLILQRHVLAAQIFDAIALVLLVNIGMVTRWKPSRNALATLRALALLAMVRVATIGLPLRTWSAGVSGLVIAALTCFAVLRAAPVFAIARRQLLLRPSSVRLVLLAVVAGLGIGFVLYRVGAPELAHSGDARSTVLVATLGASGLAIAEELLFRGALQSTAQRGAPRFGLLLASTLFAVSYLGSRNASIVLAMAIAGLVFAYTVAQQRVLCAAFLGHVALVFGAGLIWPAVFGDTNDRRSTPGTVLLLAIGVAFAIAAVLGALRLGRSRAERTRGPAAGPNEPGSLLG